MRKIINYILTEKIYQGEHALVSRAIRQTDNQSVVLKMLLAEYPSPQDIASLKHEYDLLQRLTVVDGIINVFGFEQQKSRYFIVLEDFGGQSIANFLQQSNGFETKDFLPIARRLAEIIGELHHQNVIHKDINPSNILWNPNTHQIKMIDFGIASQLPRENPIADSCQNN
jgi:serine/threonine protein kinase